MPKEDRRVIASLHNKYDLTETITDKNICYGYTTLYNNGKRHKLICPQRQPESTWQKFLKLANTQLAFWIFYLIVLYMGHHSWLCLVPYSHSSSTRQSSLI